MVLLLDYDTAGHEAVKVLRRKPLSGMLASDLVLQLGKSPHEVDGVGEIEDLIPVDLAAAAANACLQELAMYRAGSAAKVKVGEIEAAEGAGVFDRLTAVLAAKDAKIENCPSHGQWYASAGATGRPTKRPSTSICPACASCSWS